MHDPQTVIGDFPSYEWRRRLRWLPHLFTLWHVDPEADGSDDSCGWSHPKLTKVQRDNLEHLAGDEARRPWFQREHGKEPVSAADAEVLLRGAFLTVGRSIGQRITFAQASEWAAEFLHHSFDNVRGSLAFLPGWHSNFEEDRESDRQRSAHELFCILARYILRQRRRWWQHPRWHARHWRLQVRPLQSLKRVLFSPCTHCGKRFTWSEVRRGDVIGYQWDSPGPKWFRCEERIAHSRCDRAHSFAAVAN